MGDFVTLLATGAEARQALADLLAAPPSGWRADELGPDWLLLRSGDRPLPWARRADGTVVVGDYFSQDPASPSAPDGRTAFDRLLAEGWGRYVALERGEAGLRVLRDPSGGLEVAAWRRGGVMAAASTLPDALQAWWPDPLAIAWPALGRILEDATPGGGEAPLTGLDMIAPGAVWDAGQVRQAWAPAAFARAVAVRSADLEAALVATVDAAVTGWARGPVLVEISGGLDSAIVATALRRTGAEVAGAVNYHVRQAEGDERGFAREVARCCGVPLAEVEKPEAALDLDALRVVSGGLRPALDGIDTHHDLDLAERCRRAGARTLLTGRGGDNVFFQTPTPLIAAEPGGLGLRALADLARWQGRSVYGLLRAARRGEAGGAWMAQADDAGRPWLAGAADLSPAKRLQIASLAAGIGAQGPTRRGEIADLRHPLMAQPLLELCLGIPVPVLVRGGRDRGLARDAFAGLVPDAILARRGKGRLSAHYGRILARSLDQVRPLLLDGRLAGAGLIDRAAWTERLSIESLIWRGGAGSVFTALMLELWVEAWEAKLRRGPDRPGATDPGGRIPTAGPAAG
jgi:asparagine synthase (glutamine-hydrolysing)